jgi:hypothetical protein
MFQSPTQKSNALAGASPQGARLCAPEDQVVDKVPPIATKQQTAGKAFLPRNGQQGCSSDTLASGENAI